MYEYNLIDKMIFEDAQNELFDQYTRETGKEAVPEGGGHTEDFEAWFCAKCDEAEKDGCKTAKECLEHIKRNEIKCLEVDFGEDEEESSSGCKYDARSLNEGVAAWYRKAYPSDNEMADEMEPSRATFQNVIDALDSGEDVYEVMGGGDSIVRERVFEELSKLTGKDYDYFYDKWLHTN
jgi:hypothetical protein